MAARSPSALDLPLGAHQSIAGGTPRAVERGLEAGCRVVQIFVKNNNRWVGKAIEDREARAFRRAVRRAGFRHVAAHTSYLINLAAPDAGLRRQSIASLCDEIARCHRLGIRDLVLHPGAHGGDGEAAGISRLAISLDEAFDRTADTRVRVLLETAAGQGTAVGRRFEELRDILGSPARPAARRCLPRHLPRPCGGLRPLVPAGLRGDDRVARLDRRPRARRGDPRQRLEEAAGLARGPPRAHRPGRSSGSRGFRNLMRDPRLASIPKFLETPKDESFAFDRANLAALRRLAGTPAGRHAP